MAALETTDRLEGIEGLDGAQKEAAKSAGNVKAFATDFRKRTEVLIEKGQVEKSAADARTALVDAAAEGNGDLTLKALDENQLGEARIDGGRSSILLAKAMAATIRSSKDVKQMRHAAAHEDDHAKTKVLKGELEFEGDVVDHELLYEWKAEETGNLATGEAVEAHRPDQPDELYREGQDLGARLAAKVQGGRAKIRQVMETTGDLSEIQAALAA